MKTPICDFVERYADSGNLRLHMPGHKGVPFLGVEDKDITEVEGADVLYMSSGIILESEKNASMLFGTKKTLYSTEGSSLCIRAMVYLAVIYAKSKGRRPLILVARNAHKTFLGASALSGAEVEWLYPETDGNVISCPIDPDRLRLRIESMTQRPAALYVTSPDYLGNMADIGKIADVCHSLDVLLMVDNAHGAYLGFLPESRHPIKLGADICCDSAHKTLPVLTGGAYLHISHRAPDMFVDMAEQAMSMFASTSPSYLILQSLDRANLYLSEDYRERLARLVSGVEILKDRLTDKGFELLGEEGTKLTVSSKEYGYFGFEVAEYLRQNGIECEFSDPDFVVMMFTAEISDGDIARLEKALISLPKKEKIVAATPKLTAPERIMSVREAMLSQSELIPIEKAAGRVLASPSVSCPPAVPIIACGELIDEEVVKCFEYYSIDSCRVVK